MLAAKCWCPFYLHAILPWACTPPQAVQGVGRTSNAMKAKYGISLTEFQTGITAAAEPGAGGGSAKTKPARSAYSSTGFRDDDTEIARAVLSHLATSSDQHAALDGRLAGPSLPNPLGDRGTTKKGRRQKKKGRIENFADHSASRKPLLISAPTLIAGPDVDHYATLRSVGAATAADAPVASPTNLGPAPPPPQSPATPDAEPARPSSPSPRPRVSSGARRKATSAKHSSPGDKLRPTAKPSPPAKPKVAAKPSPPAKPTVAAKPSPTAKPTVAAKPYSGFVNPLYDSSSPPRKPAPAAKPAVAVTKPAVLVRDASVPIAACDAAPDDTSRTGRLLIELDALPDVDTDQTYAAPPAHALVRARHEYENVPTAKPRPVSAAMVLPRYLRTRRASLVHSPPPKRKAPLPPPKPPKPPASEIVTAATAVPVDTDYMDIKSESAPVDAGYAAVEVGSDIGEDREESGDNASDEDLPPQKQKGRRNSTLARQRLSTSSFSSAPPPRAPPARPRGASRGGGQLRSASLTETAAQRSTSTSSTDGTRPHRNTSVDSKRSPKALPRGGSFTGLNPAPDPSARGALERAATVKPNKPSRPMSMVVSRSSSLGGSLGGSLGVAGPVPQPRRRRMTTAAVPAPPRRPAAGPVVGLTQRPASLSNLPACGSSDPNADADDSTS